MRILKASASNFQSYKEIEFEFDGRGLCLVSGPTGAGKSTLLDLVPWVLYGVTSKDGAVDDVRSWASDEPTTGTCRLEAGGKEITVHRVRGGPSQNDLYWLEPSSSEPRRGKDLAETQRLLEERLGMSAELFMMSAYISQFNTSDSFFIAKAKDRREVLEKIADQEFAIRLGERASEARKKAKRDLDAAETEAANAAGQVSALESSVKSMQDGEKKWESDRRAMLVDLTKRQATFAEDQEKKAAATAARAADYEKKRDEQTDKLLADIEQVVGLIEKDVVFTTKLAQLEDELGTLGTASCPTCKAPVNSRRKFELAAEAAKVREQRLLNQGQQVRHKSLQDKLRAIVDAPNPYQAEASALRAAENPYGSQIEAFQSQANPFTQKVKSEKSKLKEAKQRATRLTIQGEVLRQRVASLTWLYDKSFEMRGLMMERAVRQIQDATNGYLERHFDAALRIQLSLSGSDKLDVDITNNGHRSPFRQLSGGERCMLKLCFGLSVMTAAANTAGSHTNVVMLDEAFNGLSDDLKVRAFGLLQELESHYSTVLVIDHSEELKAHFANRFQVAMINGWSTLDEDGQPADIGRGAR